MKLVRSGLGLEPDAFRTEPQIMELSYGHWEGELAALLADKLNRMPS
jgi:probable phosphoglycerate mutase